MTDEALKLTAQNVLTNRLACYDEVHTSLATGVMRLLGEVNLLRAIFARSSDLNAEPAQDYAGLKRQFSALKVYANSQEKIRDHYRDAFDALSKVDRTQSAGQLNAERNTNERLTNDLLKTEVQRDELSIECDRLRDTNLSAAHALGLPVEADAQDVVDAIQRLQCENAQRLKVIQEASKT